MVREEPDFSSCRPRHTSIEGQISLSEPRHARYHPKAADNATDSRLVAPVGLQAVPYSPFSLQKFLNKTGPAPVFICEGKRVVAGEAILNEVATADRDRIESRDEALETLVREHARLVYRIAYAVLRRHHDAEDATQETFMRVIRHSSMLSQIEDPKMWLARIAWRIAVDQVRQGRRNREVSIDDSETTGAEIASPGTPADLTAQGAQLESVLEKLISALPAKLREPLVLSAIEEMSPREVAATLGIKEAAVRSRVFRARHLLKEKLAQRASGK